MNIGIGQILLILLIVVILFGKLPNLFEDVASGIKTIKNATEEDKPKLEKENKDNFQSYDKKDK